MTIYLCLWLIHLHGFVCNVNILGTPNWGFLKVGLVFILLCSVCLPEYPPPLPVCFETVLLCYSNCSQVYSLQSPYSTFVSSGIIDADCSAQHSQFFVCFFEQVYKPHGSDILVRMDAPPLSLFTPSHSLTCS